MGYTRNGYGKPDYDDTYSFPQDSQAAVDFADEFANVRRGTSAERQSAPAAKRRIGSLWIETDTGTTYIDTGEWKLWSKGWTNFNPAISGFTLVGGAFTTAKYKIDRGVATVKIRASVQAMAGNPTIDLPVASADAALEHLPGTVGLFPGAGSEIVGAARKATGNQVVFFYHLTSGSVVYINNISGSAPFAWGATGKIVATFSYEVA